MAETGTFLSRDPVESEPDYLYARGNPTNLKDSSGFCAEVGDEACWGVYDQLVSLCPECAEMERPTLTGERKLHEENIQYLQTIMERLQTGWRPKAYWTRLIFEKNSQLVRQVTRGEITDLEGFARLTEYAASVTPDCTTCFIDNVGSVLTGHSVGRSALNEVLYQLRLFQLDPYYQAQLRNPLRQSGYDCMFQDPNPQIGGGVQPHHYWFYVQVGYESGLIMGNIGNILHETLLTNDPRSRSFQDLALGVEGVELGVDLYWERIHPLEVGKHIRRTLRYGSGTGADWKNIWTDIRLIVAYNSLRNVRP